MNLAFAALGAAGWTLAEYLIHRFAGHETKRRNPFKVEHTTHHATPGYFAPPAKKTAVACGVLTPLAGLAVLALGFGPGLSFVGGFAVMYTAYEVAHYAMHAWAPRTAFGRILRKHHFYHHYHKPSLNHGVTTMLWDRVFGTRFAVVEPIRVPRRFASAWMLDGQGAIRPELAADYRLGER